MDMSAVVYTYDPKANPEQRHLTGVPLRDLTNADLARLPAHIVNNIATCEFYTAVTNNSAVRRKPGPSEIKEG